MASNILESTPTFGAALVILGSIWFALRKGAGVMKERAERSQEPKDWASVYAFDDVEAIVGWLTSGLSFGYVAFVVGEQQLSASIFSLFALLAVWGTYKLRSAAQLKGIAPGKGSLDR